MVLLQEPICQAALWVDARGMWIRGFGFCEGSCVEFGAEGAPCSCSQLFTPFSGVHARPGVPVCPGTRLKSTLWACGLCEGSLSVDQGGCGKHAATGWGEAKGHESCAESNMAVQPSGRLCVLQGLLRGFARAPALSDGFHQNPPASATWLSLVSLGACCSSLGGCWSPRMPEGPSWLAEGAWP